MIFSSKLEIIIYSILLIIHFSETVNTNFVDEEVDDNEDHGICHNWVKTVESIGIGIGNCSMNRLTLQCFGGMNNLEDFSVNKIKKTEQLVLCGWPNETFDAPLILKHFPKLQILRIEHSNLTHFNNDFPELLHLESINISWTHLRYTRPTLFKKLHSLKFLDLRWNRLDHMEGPLILPPHIFQSLYLAGNPWNCIRNLKWLLNYTKAEHVIDRESLKCSDAKYNGRPLLTVMQFKLNLKEACANHEELRNCTCYMSYVRLSDDGHSLSPIFSINCSHLNLDHLPSFVPENTTIFYANDNKITNVEPLRNIYRYVQDIYLDYNHIQSIDVLESDNWLENFRVFSLKGNKLTRLPVYALDNALEKNHNVAKLYLSLNPWRCDCLFTMRLQELLMKYHTIIKDSVNVTCKYIEGDKNFGSQILALTRTDVCKLPTEYKIQPLDLLNAVLGTLIVLVLSKLAYDYYHYRKSGRLPWIITKLP